MVMVWLETCRCMKFNGESIYRISKLKNYNNKSKGSLITNACKGKSISMRQLGGDVRVAILYNTIKYDSLG